MPDPSPPPGQVSTEIAAEKRDRAVIGPLADVHQLVDDETPQTGVVVGEQIGVDEYPSDQSDGSGPPGPDSDQQLRRSSHLHPIDIHRVELGPEFLGVEPGGSEDLPGSHPTTTLTRRGGLEMTLSTW